MQRPVTFSPPVPRGGTTRRNLRWFAVRLGLVVALAGMSAFADPRPTWAFFSTFQRLAVWGSILALVFAIRERQLAHAPGELNHWDESLAFGALCLLARFCAHGLQP
jgi:hypothetical protein